MQQGNGVAKEGTSVIVKIFSKKKCDSEDEEEEGAAAKAPKATKMTARGLSMRKNLLPKKK